MFCAAATLPLEKSSEDRWIFEPQQFESLLESENPIEPYDWDSEKAAFNLDKHGVAFQDVYNFDWASALEVEDTRYDYGEIRMQAL